MIDLISHFPAMFIFARCTFFSRKNVGAHHLLLGLGVAVVPAAELPGCFYIVRCSLLVLEPLQDEPRSVVPA